MKDENEFNAMLSRKLTKLRPAVFAQKLADKYKVGLADFTLWKMGRAAVVECKFLRELPAPGALLLKHVFSGPQQNYLRNVAATGSHAFGLVGIEDRNTMYLIPNRYIPESGNWVTRDFTTRIADGTITPMELGNVEALVSFTFPAWSLGPVIIGDIDVTT